MFSLPPAAGREEILRKSGGAQRRQLATGDAFLWSVAAFQVSDMAAEVARLKARGVTFTREPMSAGPVTIAMFSDGCGNLIQLHQKN